MEHRVYWFLYLIVYLRQQWVMICYSHPLFWSSYCPNLPMGALSVCIFFDMPSLFISLKLWFFQLSCMDVSVGPSRRLSTEEQTLSNCDAGEDIWEILHALRYFLDSKEIKPVNLRGNQPWIFIEKNIPEFSRCLDQLWSFLHLPCYKPSNT